MLMRTSSQDVDSRNLFLRQLSREDRSLLAKRLEWMTIAPGTCLLSTNGPIDAAYFPHSAIISIEQHAGASDRIETALVGYEGMVGWSGLISPGRSPSTAIAQMGPGTMLRIAIGDLADACAASTTLMTAVARFIEIIMVQMAHAIVSHLRDTIERRVCRWLLMRHDRMPTDQLLVRHDEISASLGSRRASVTDCLHILEGERLIRCYRGRVMVRDRSGLELRAGDSYGAAEAHYRSLIGPFGRSHGEPGYIGLHAARSIEAAPYRSGSQYLPS